MNKRLVILKTFLWAFAGMLTVLTAVRFLNGLGATTNLNDAAPWGLWIAFDVMAGVALAAGGFVLAGTVYIFGLEKYRPLVRPAILTAFLGYAAVAVGLLYDLGLPWNIWHPMIHWQPHSVLFEVAMCVMTYLTVLALEFAPAVLEHPRMTHPLVRRAIVLLKRITIPLVIAGIVLSTLHQSSLGSLFLIVPHRLHPLWYSPILYVLFFVSAVGLGMMMVTLEGLLSAFFFRHKIHRELLAGLGKAASFVLGLYLLLRLGDLWIRGVLPAAFDGSRAAMIFLLEILVCALLPALILAVPRIRKTVAGLATASVLTVVGMIMTRINLAIVAIRRPEELPYFPALLEWGVSIGIVSAAALAFLFLVERLRVYGEPAQTSPEKPGTAPSTLHRLNPFVRFAPRRFSFAFVGAAALTMLLLPEQAILGNQPKKTPVAPPRRVGATRSEEKPARLTISETGKDVLAIDGNRDGRLVLFDHAGHAEMMGGGSACASCHHIDLPLDRRTSCSQCHRDMYEPVDLFRHSTHVRHLGENDGCSSCHPPGHSGKTREKSTACSACHAGEVPAESMSPPKERWQPAPGYMDALHARCIGCHEELVKEGQGPETLSRCSTCHNADETGRLEKLRPKKKGCDR